MKMKANGAGSCIPFTDKTLTAAIIIIVSVDLLPRFDLYVAETNGVGRAGWTIDHVTSITYVLNSVGICSFNNVSLV